MPGVTINPAHMRFLLLLAALPLCAQTVPLLERARAGALEYSAGLPDFLCTEVVSRYLYGPNGWYLRDTLLLKVDFTAHRESYTLTAVDGQAAGGAFLDVGGVTSTGEFGSLLRRIFDPKSRAGFSRVREATLHDRKVAVYRYRTVEGGGFNLLHRGTDKISTLRVPDHGSIYIDTESAQVLRIESETGDIPASFPIRYSSMSVDYASASIGGRSYLLPSRAQTETRSRTGRTRNDIEFIDYRKFEASTQVQFGETSH